MATSLQRSFTGRMKGAALLDVATYEDVEADQNATTQAAGVVAIVAVAQAIGSLGMGGNGIVMAVFSAIFGWLIWSGLTYLIGDKLLGGTATWGELLRTIGFAQAPGVLYVLGVVPLVGSVIRLVVGVWILVAGIIAIRQALDFSTGKAVLTALVGWFVIMIPMAILAGLFAAP